MPWNEAGRAKYEVIRARYSSDMSGAEFAQISGLLPPRKRRGRNPAGPRIILNALFYLIGPAVRGGSCPRIFLASRPSRTASTTGGTAAFGRGKSSACW